MALKRASTEADRRELAAKTQRTEEAMLALLKHLNIIEGRGKVKEAGRDIPSLLLEVGKTDVFGVLNTLWCVGLLFHGPVTLLETACSRLLE